jgi:hypothetical protein
MHYSVNESGIKYYFEFYKLSSPDTNNLDMYLVNRFNLQ